jgi:hypothetical protein
LTVFPGIFNNWDLYNSECLQGYGVFVRFLYFPLGFFSLFCFYSGSMLSCGPFDISVWSFLSFTLNLGRGVQWRGKVGDRSLWGHISIDGVHVFRFFYLL